MAQTLTKPSSSVKCVKFCNLTHSQARQNSESAGTHARTHTHTNKQTHTHTLSETNKHILCPGVARKHARIWNCKILNYEGKASSSKMSPPKLKSVFISCWDERHGLKPKLQTRKTKACMHLEAKHDPRGACAQTIHKRPELLRPCTPKADASPQQHPKTPHKHKLLLCTALYYINPRAACENLMWAR